jgi:hypothetical protein
LLRLLCCAVMGCGVEAAHKECDCGHLVQQQSAKTSSVTECGMGCPTPPRALALPSSFRQLSAQLSAAGLTTESLLRESQPNSKRHQHCSRHTVTSCPAPNSPNGQGRRQAQGQEGVWAGSSGRGGARRRGGGANHCRAAAACRAAS